MKIRLLPLLFLFLVSVLTAQNNLDFKLFELPDVIFKQIETPEDYAAAYELRIKQPIDHTDPAKGHFYQRAFLSHRGFDRPTVMATEGYNRGGNRIYELTDIVDGNQIDIEHRYFGESIPENPDYKHLNLEQATADLHHINRIFRKLYTGKWLSTGISKGGQTTIFYRYLYPQDVDVSVPYVSPLNLSLEDERIYDWLEKAGTEECRTDIERVQRTILENREEALTLLRWYARGAKLDFNYLTFEQAFEYAVLEYPFSFFQWGSDCAKIPAADADFEEILGHFMDVSGIAFFSDRDVAYFGSHYYQAGTQMGYYGYEAAPFKDLLKALPNDKNPSAVFMPDGKPPVFNGELPNKVAKWLKTDGNNFIYIYGKNDTWSATGVPPSEKTNSLWVVMEGKSHGDARIKNMTAEEKQRVEEKLEEWLGDDFEIR